MPAVRIFSRPASGTFRSAAALLGRRLALPIVAILALLAVAFPAGAAASTLPPEGIFDYCNLDTQLSTCVQRLSVIHSGGFQVVVLDANDGSPSSISAYAAAAQQVGIKVMWEISAPSWWQGTSASGDFPQFASACGCTGNSSLLTYMITYLGGLPATYGYYAADDTMLSSGDQAGVSAYVSQVKTLDPAHPVILSSADETQTSQYGSIGDMNAAEIYPITTSPLMPVSKNQDMWGAVAQQASDVQRMATNHGKTSAFILQAFSWGDNLSDGEAIGACTPSMSQLQCWNSLIYPTASDQRQLRNEVLKHAHPGLILWWSFMGTYGQSGGDTYSIYPTGTAAADHWAALTAAINAPAPGVKLTHGTRAGKHHKRHHHRRRHHHHHHRRYHRRHPRRLL